MERRLLAVAAVTLASSLISTPSQAIDGSAGWIRTQSIVPQQLEVASDGSRYAGVHSLGNIVADVELAIETGGWINDWRAWLKVGEEAEPLALWTHFDEHPYAQSYHHGPRPREVSGAVQILVPAAAYGDVLAYRCNTMANVLRSQGLSNEEIFSQDRIIQMGVRAGIKWDANPFGGVHSTFGSSDDDLPWSKISKFDVVCKKSPPRRDVEEPEPPTRTKPKVKSAKLELVERSGLSGVCKIILSGVIRTLESDTTVRFRYKDDAGHQSEVHLVTSDHRGVARFSHEYPIANDPEGDESGKVRMVGVSHGFQSAKVPYDMNCTAPGADAFQTLLPPSLQFRVVPLDKVMVGRQICYSRVKIIGEILGRGPMSGYAAFVGDNHYISPPHAYSVGQGDTETVLAYRELDWSPDPQHTWTTAPAPGNQPKSQTIDIGFNVTGSNNAVVASLPKRGFTFTCTFPKINPEVKNDQGLTVEPRQPAAEPRAPRRLLQKPPGAGRPALPEQNRLRLRFTQ